MTITDISGEVLESYGVAHEIEEEEEQEEQAILTETETNTTQANTGTTTIINITKYSGVQVYAKMGGLI